MTRLRIRCRVPADDRTPSGLIFNRDASISETEVFAVGDDGVEVSLTNITEIEWRVASDGEPAKAVVTFDRVDLDVEAECDVDAARFDAMYHALGAKTAVELQETLARLIVDVERAQAACGPERVQGEPLAETIARMRERYEAAPVKP